MAGGAPLHQALVARPLQEARRQPCMLSVLAPRKHLTGMYAHHKCPTP